MITAPKLGDIQGGLARLGVDQPPTLVLVMDRGWLVKANGICYWFHGGPTATPHPGVFELELKLTISGGF